MQDYTNYNFNGQKPNGSQAINTGYDVGLRAFMNRTYMHMSVGMLITAIAAYFAVNNQAVYGFASKLFFPLAIVEVLMVVYLSVRVRKMSESTAKMTFYAYAALNGLTLSLYLSQHSPEAVARAFFSTSAMFGAMTLYGMTTKKDLTGWGSFLMMGLFGIIISSVVNFFLQSSGLAFATSFISVIVFTGLVAYDTQMLRRTYDSVGVNDLGKAAIMGALSLYLDFINIFLQMLRFFGDRR
jgi:uncharacterized protein